MEYDGGTHGDIEQQVRDIRRQEGYGDAGWIEVRIGKAHMQDQPRYRRLRVAFWVSTESSSLSKRAEEFLAESPGHWWMGCAAP